MTKEYEILQKEYFAAVESDNESDMAELSKEIAEHQRKMLFKACIKHLKIQGCYKNLFRLASNYSKVTVEQDLTPESYHYEIPCWDTKHKRPIVVEF